MQTENIDMGGGPGGGQVNSRWNPTKEQINLLESLYKQGIRTPSADQIQQITARLKDFGHIEGKNVFYWFQNHKARQRQKQKQESLAYFNRYLYKPQQQQQLVFPRPSTNGVVCGSYYIPQSDVGFYPQYSTVLLPAGSFKRKPRSEKADKARAYVSTDRKQQEAMNGNCNETYQETLPLFPLHPTGILQGREESFCSHGSIISAEDSIAIAAPSSFSENNTVGIELCSSDKPFFDFFSGQDALESD
ncbi:WUSCHEL-related homeobox 2 [Manihot esculenta]|uniref:Homeobox domain-containing protein n=1 Tax=Manihot esculenta TaxID=3983 RepID=A0A2C9VZ31_MANES|nr:WUSCHEL-related homeobox 2 [Manihot esculenta]OAY51798.1 hypothetical protein MANES_04G033600v8 [Manihot esculenta]